jgi:Family of unknown function (DUF6220)
MNAGGIAVVRRVSGGLHLFLAAAILLAVCAQVYLIGAYIFGAGTDALDAHKDVGWTAHSLELLLFLVSLAAWLPGRDIGLSLGLAVIGTVQVTLASESEWVGALHPLLALAVLAFSWLLLQRGVRRRRA